MGIHSISLAGERELSIHKDYVKPPEGEGTYGFGFVVVRLASMHHERSAEVTDALIDVLVADALEFDSPLELGRRDISIYDYRSGTAAGSTQIGVEALIPKGTQVTDEYTRIGRIRNIRRTNGY